MSNTEKKLTSTEVTKLVVNDFITANIDQFELNWKSNFDKTIGMPCNPFSGTIYSGSNYFLLSMFNPFGCNQFATKKQIKANKGTYEKNALEFPIVKAKPNYFLDGKKLSFKDLNNLSDADKKLVSKSMSLFYFKVINLEQTNLDYKVSQVEKNEYKPTIIDTFLHSYEADNCEIRVVTSDKAYYVPALDKITLPLRTQFHTLKHFYKTAFHEIVHSTGAKHRLNRSGVADIDTRDIEKYATEELIAEIGACYLVNHFGNFEVTKENSLAYIQSWKSRIMKNPDVLREAMTGASRAYDFLLPYVK